MNNSVFSLDDLKNQDHSGIVEKVENALNQLNNHDINYIFSNFMEIVQSLEPQALQGVLSGLRNYLIERPRFFAELWKQLDSLSIPSATEAQEDGIARSLMSSMREKGVAVWEGLYADPSFLEEARALVRKTAHECRQMNRSDSQIKREEHSAIHNINVTSPWRTRASYIKDRVQTPEIWNVVIRDQRLLNVGAMYYGTQPTCNGLVSEELIPGGPEQSWHIDGICDQYKVMVLLEDTTTKNGPLQVKQRTRQKLPNTHLPALHGTYCFGRDWSHFVEEVAELSPAKTWEGTGKAGDVIFFDTLNIHRGSPCQEGSRLTLTVNYSVTTVKNFYLKHLGGDVNL